MKTTTTIFLIIIFHLLPFTHSLAQKVDSTASTKSIVTDTVKKNNSHGDTASTPKKKRRLFSFFKKKLNKELKRVEKNNTPVVSKNNNSHVADTTKGKSSANGIYPATTNSKPSSKDSLHKSTGIDTTKHSLKNGLLSKLDHLSAHGSISAGYDYGVLPFASNLQVPMGYFHSEGQGQFSVGVLPFNGSFYYSDIKNISGLNNYFRFSFDAQKFQQEYKDKEAQEEQKLKGSLGSLYKDKQMAEQKLLYLTSIQNQNLKKPAIPSIAAPSLQGANSLQKDESAIKTLTSSDSTGNSKAPNTQSDSLNKDAQTVKSDSANASKAFSKEEPNSKNLKSDSIAASKSVLKSAPVRDADSVKADIVKYKQQIDKDEKEIDKITREINAVKRDESALEHNNPYMSKVYNVMSGFKKLEVGLCYPDYSTFLVNGMAIKGINIEYQKEDVFVAATEGTTVNTLLFTNNTLQNHLVNMQNLYNMFDFTSVQNGRKIMDVKTGYGTKEGTHLFVGVLYGAGLPSYLNQYTTVPDNSLSKNYVLELDGKWAITKSSSFNIIYGKSSTQTKGDNYYITDGGLMSSQHSKAIMGKYEQRLLKTQTRVTLTGRWVDPYFNSFGLGYMRADNFRYEIKAEQPFGKKIKVSAFYRKDEDDVLQLYQFHTVLQTIGTNATIKLMRSLTLRIGYTPVIEHMWGSSPSYNIFNNNNICNVILSYTPVIKNTYMVFNTSYNYYRITTDTQTIAFQNFSFSYMVRFKNSFNNNFSVNWFKTAPTDSLNNNAWMLTDEIGYTFLRGFTLSIGGKAAWSPVTDKWQYGYLAKLRVPLVKHLSCEITAEKLVLGDFYNSFDILQIQKFPYYCQGKVILSW